MQQGFAAGGKNALERGVNKTMKDRVKRESDKEVGKEFWVLKLIHLVNHRENRELYQGMNVFHDLHPICTEGLDFYSELVLFLLLFIILDKNIIHFLRAKLA